MKLDKNQKAFLALVRAGLWANIDSSDIRYKEFLEPVDWDNVYWLSEEQSVIGVVLAGIELSNIKPPKDLLLQWIGEVQMIEQKNKSMNLFIAELIEKMRNADIYTLLVKGQGIAQCYDRPLWRACGDVDLLLSDSNYLKTKNLLIPLASNVEREEPYEKHIAMTIDTWVVELHGSLKTGISSRIDKGVVSIQNDVFYLDNVRSWMNEDTQVFLPSVNNDVLFVFTHILKHFFHKGIGLRQICDWCRLLWTFKDSLNHELLESRIQKMGIMTEWKAFAALAVDYLGMPKDVMPLYSGRSKWKKKAERILNYIFETGSFGHNRDTSYSEKYPSLISKLISLYIHTIDTIRCFTIFPIDSLKSWNNMICFGIRDLVRGN